MKLCCYYPHFTVAEKLNNLAQGHTVGKSRTGRNSNPGSLDPKSVPTNALPNLCVTLPSNMPYYIPSTSNAPSPLMTASYEKPTGCQTAPRYCMYITVYNPPKDTSC